jgi:hypothetical protein
LTEPYEALAEHVRSKGTPAAGWCSPTTTPTPTRWPRRWAHQGAARHGRRATAAYGGIIGRAENREMVRALKMKVSHVKTLQLSRFRHFALVDTQPGTGNNQLPAGVVPEIVLDHHPRRAGEPRRAVARHPAEYGATATMVAEYLLASGMRITAHEATALVYAIRTETRDFGREASGPDKGGLRPAPARECARRTWRASSTRGCRSPTSRCCGRRSSGSPASTTWCCRTSPK